MNESKRPAHPVGSRWLAYIERERANVDQANRKLTSTVIQARKSGQTWEAIGTALGVTKQAAQQLYGPLT